MSASERGPFTDAVVEILRDAPDEPIAIHAAITAVAQKLENSITDVIEDSFTRAFTRHESAIQAYEEAKQYLETQRAASQQADEIMRGIEGNFRINEVLERFPPRQGSDVQRDAYLKELRETDECWTAALKAHREAQKGIYDAELASEVAILRVRGALAAMQHETAMLNGEPR